MRALVVTGSPVRRSSITGIRRELGLDDEPDAVLDVVCWAPPEDDIADLVDRVTVLRGSSGAERLTAAPQTTVDDQTDLEARLAAAADRRAALAAAPRLSARRLRHGVAWRARRWRTRLRPLRARATRLSRIFARDPGHVLWRQARGRDDVVALATAADVIVAHDPVAALTCWHLARRIPTTPTVLGTAAGRRAVVAARHVASSAPPGRAGGG